jgi:hypothetical protein
MCKPNILARWEVLKMIIMAIISNWNACYSIHNGESGEGGGREEHAYM